MACDERDRLIREFGKTVGAYSVALKEMAEGATPKDRYQVTRRVTEDLRLQCEKARVDLERHRATHKC